MFSVVIIAATRSDIELSSNEAFKTGNYRRVTILPVPAMLFCSVFYGIVFMNLRAENPDIPDVSIARFGLIVGILTTLVCGFLQYKLRSSPAIEASS